MLSESKGGEDDDHGGTASEEGGRGKGEQGVFGAGGTVAWRRGRGNQEGQPVRSQQQHGEDPGPPHRRGEVGRGPGAEHDKGGGGPLVGEEGAGEGAQGEEPGGQAAFRRLPPGLGHHRHRCGTSRRQEPNFIFCSPIVGIPLTDPLSTTISTHFFFIALRFHSPSPPTRSPRSSSTRTRTPSSAWCLPRAFCTSPSSGYSCSRVCR